MAGAPFESHKYKFIFLVLKQISMQAEVELLHCAEKTYFRIQLRLSYFMASFSSVFTVCFLSLVTTHAFISCECLMHLKSLESTGGTIVSFGNSYISPVLSKLFPCIKTHYIYMHMPWDELINC